jgi:hypothetical protein
MPSEQTYTRRGLLRRGTAGGLVVGGAAATYGAARFAAKDGTVTVRHLGAIEERDDGRRYDVDLFYREIADDGLDDPQIHEALQGRLDGGTGPDDPYRVPGDLHRNLAERFEDLTYHVGHRCPAARCSTPKVDRGTFNGLALREPVRLLYLPGSVRAVPVP